MWILLILLLCLCLPGEGFHIASGGGAGRPAIARLHMKIFDWKKRAEFQNFKLPEDYSIHVTNIFPIPGSRKKFHRIGRGIAAGQGASCGRGMRGQKSRAGRGAGVRPYFEGGQTPLHRRIPKYARTMKGHRRRIYELLKISMLNQCEDFARVDYQFLLDRKIATKPNKGRKIWKIVGSGESLSAQGLTVFAHAFTKSAREEIESRGGHCVLLSLTKHTPLPEQFPPGAPLPFASSSSMESVEEEEDEEEEYEEEYEEEDEEEEMDDAFNKLKDEWIDEEANEQGTEA